MKPLPFAKVVGTGNDFILVDARRGASPAISAAKVRSWCDRKRGIGADGLLLVTPSRRGDARMRIFNADGSEASSCGNGLRCVAWYLYNHDHRKKTMTLETGAGVVSARIIGKERVRILMTAPRKLHLGQQLSVRGKKHQIHSVDTGVPHAVMLVPSLEKVDLCCLGPAVRWHKRFKPSGTNVDVLRIDSPHKAAVRTYERGVEGETLACGTGAVASVVIGAALGRLKPPVSVKTASGETLEIGFRQSRNPWEGLYLEGPARILFEGRSAL